MRIFVYNIVIFFSLWKLKKAVLFLSMPHWIDAALSFDVINDGDEDGTEDTSGAPGAASLPCLVYIHGESYSWNAGNPYDGTVLAARGKMIVVTINYRLGVLGFLKTGAKGSAQGNFGLMDLVAGLHWLRENLPAFGGDPERVTLMGHGTGAALANFLAVSPVAKDLLKRVILLSGSGLSSWALQRDPLAVKRKVAEQTGCHGDLLEEDLAPCLRNKPLAELLAIKLEPPRFLPGFAPFVDGTVLLNPSQASPPSLNVGGGVAAVTTAAGYELADFPHRELLFGLTTVESYLDLNAQDLEFGFNETRRDRILRTYVRNAYFYHLNEIFSTLKNEYTDWDRPVQNPLNVRDGTLEVLSDGHTAAPLIRLGYLHALRGGKTYFAHFQHLSTDKDYPQRSGSVNGEDLPYFLGAPLTQTSYQQHAPHWPYPAHNYTQQDRAVSAMLIHYVANFVANGNPNPPKSSSEAIQHENQPFQSSDSTSPETIPFWDTYDTINQLYLEIGEKSEMRSHYRGHKMSLWLSLIPQLHRSLPGDVPDMSMRHHHFQEEGANYYEGQVRPQSMKRPVLPQTPPAVAPRGTAAPVPPPAPAPTTECPPNATMPQTTPAVTTTPRDDGLLRRLASSHYQSYTAALTVTIAVGCFLLLLNILIFAGIYHQRGSRSGRSHKNKDEIEANSCSSSSGENYETKASNFERQSSYGFGCKASSYLMKPGSKYDLKTFTECGKPSFGEYSCYDEKNISSQYEKRSLADISLCSLPDISNADGSVSEFQKSPLKRSDYGGSIVRIDTQKPDIQRINNQSIRSLENQTSSFHESVNLNVNISSFCDSANTADSSTQVKFVPVVSGAAGEAEEEVGAASETPARSVVSVGAQSEPTTCDVGTNVDGSPSIPEAPPPPKGAPGAPPGAGILRQSGQPSTSGGTAPNPTGIMKKRVQIQEISV